MTQINTKDFFDELNYSISKKDRIKLSIVLEHLPALDKESQHKALSLIKETDFSFSVFILLALIKKNPLIGDSVPSLNALLKQMLLQYPPALIEALQESPPSYKQFFVEIAQKLSLPETATPLEEMLHSTSNDQLKVLIIETLASIGAQSSVNPITECLSAKNRKLQVAAVKALGAIATPSAIERLAECTGTDNALDILIVSILAQIQNPQALSILTRQLCSHHSQLRNYALQKLIDIGNKAVPFLLPILDTDDENWIIHSLHALGNIGDSSAVNPIRKLLLRNPHNSNIRFAAYEALSGLTMQTGFFTLTNGLTDEDLQVAMAAARAIDANLNEILINGLKMILSGDEGDVKEIIKVILLAQSERIFAALIEQPVFQKEAEFLLEQHSYDEARQFYVDLINKQKLPSHSLSLVSSQPTKGKKYLSIWAVDDSKLICTLYKKALQDPVFDITVFQDPRQVLEQLGQSQPDLLFTDLNMPHITGLELAEKIRTTVSSKELPIVLVTTQSDVHNSGELENAGITDVIIKPFSETMLRNMVDKYCIIKS